MRVWVVLVLLTGCDVPFGLDEVRLSDASADTPSIDASIDACSHSLPTLIAAEDTQLLNEGNNPNPANRYGSADTIDVALNGTSRALLRFVLTPDMVAALAPTGTAVSAALELNIRTSGGACGSGCITGATEFSVYAANNYWNEGSTGYIGAAWYNRYQTTSSDGQPWQVPGADGAMDRSMMSLGAGAVAAGAQGTVTVMLPLDGTLRSEIASRIEPTSRRMSLILVPTSGGTLYLYSREGGSAARFTVSVCP